jgi:serine/threonine protein kinase
MSAFPAMNPSPSDPASGTPDARRLLAFYEELADEIGRGERPDLARHVARRPEFAEEVAAAVLAELRGLEASTEGPPPDAAAPTRLGPYLLGREIGRGGQATVYEAEDPRLGRTVALKVYADLGPGAEAVLRRFRREAAAASRIDHPAICPVYDAGVAGGAAYIAMRLVPGETLAARLARERRESRPSRTKPDRARASTRCSRFSNRRRGRSTPRTKPASCTATSNPRT